MASGPFFTSDSLSNDPLTELVSNVKELKPNLTLLMAPFLDEKHPAVKKGPSKFSKKSFLDQCFRMTHTVFDAIKGEITLKDIDGLLLEKIGQIEQSGSRVLLISSARDFHADPIYPTPVIEFLPNSKNNQYMNGDPAFINVSGP